MKTAASALIAASFFVSAAAYAADFRITIQDHKFVPQDLSVPAKQRITLIIKNLDASPAEFESHELVREKVVKGGAEIVVYVGPLNPGAYHYYDDFHRNTTTGVITAK